MTKSVSRDALIDYCNRLLSPQDVKDYAPNGLQVEGKPVIKKLVTGVTASQALIDAAIDADADMILVHHGYFWGNENPCIVGMKQRRIKALLMHDINLLGYHLPLDVHETFGNNAQLAKVLAINVEGRAGKLDLINYGRFPKPLTVSEFTSHLDEKFSRQPLIVGSNNKKIETVAWCTGGAQGYLEDAIGLGVDAYISGEASEQTTHIAVENNIVYAAAGHHATERYGVKALGEHLKECFDLDHVFIDIDNPI